MLSWPFFGRQFLGLTSLSYGHTRVVELISPRQLFITSRLEVTSARIKESVNSLSNITRRSTNSQSKAFATGKKKSFINGGVGPGEVYGAAVARPRFKLATQPRNPISMEDYK
ncbi:hypothetical protein ACKVWC_000431 [Pyricularia oryzae]